MARAGGVEGVVKVLNQYRNDPILVRLCISSIANLSVLTSESRDRITKTGGIEAIVETAADYANDLEVARMAHKALWPLAGHSCDWLLASCVSPPCV